MIPKLRIQLSNPVVFLLVAFFIPLAAFFAFALWREAVFFTYLTVGLVAIIIYLSLLRARLFQKQAELELKLQDITECRNLVEAEIRQEEQAVASLKQKIVNLSQLKGLTEFLGQCLYTEDTSKVLSSEVNRLFGDDTTVILYLFHSRTGELGLSSSKKGQMRVNIKSKRGGAFDQWVVKTMQPLLVEDARSDYRFDMDKIEGDESRLVRSLISVPLMVGHKALGILRVDHPRENYFATDDLRFLTTIGDLTGVAIENAQLYEHVEQLAIRDGLTNLFLRRYLMDRMAEEISRHMRRSEPMSFLILDLDKFKDYNDRFGHIAGDIVLRTVAMMLMDYFNKIPGSLVCRYGGEEFCVLLPDCPKNQAKELAEGIRQRVADQGILLRREKTNITVSIGLATFPDDAKGMDEIIAIADKALYEAKNAGRNSVRTASGGETQEKAG